MSKKEILNRFAVAEKGEIIIDVSANRVKDLYNDFDKTAPYIKKTLKENWWNIYSVMREK